ncbi:TPA: 2-(3-amino-3-carboxypropyl)histidine synthase [Candidatus Woesearchaeota archaeon]|nr:2-(3-amino-3-carboxypropyl)histidine synthase [Candidatus Woesearchaeota archaeon]HII68451.1 2-(3-amino-3-carboxypropyl)histidine synthase [Candidatus Woesearchaeota archaeon]
MMEVMFIDAKTKEEKIILDSGTVDYCKKYKVIAVYAAVQFASQLPTAVSQLAEAGIEVITSQPDRTSREFQILGCDTFHPGLRLARDPDAYLYVGDGLFHPRALALAQKDADRFREIIRYDPFAKQHFILDESDVRAILRSYKGNLMAFLAATNIGVIVTTKSGQQQFVPGKELAKRYPEKSVYYFAENTIDFSRLEDFPFIEVWVNTACPRIGYDDATERRIAMVNLNDAMQAKELLSSKNLLTKE